MSGGELAMRIDGARLLERIEELARHGAGPGPGISRLAFTDEDRAGRDRVVSWMRELGLDVRVDGIGNVFGRRAGRRDLPAVMTGSHIDSVARGGTLDGAYGVLAGLEVVAACNDTGRVTERPLEVSFFSNEEGTRFQPDMMGSLVAVGGLDLEAALATTGNDGTRLADELERIGYRGAEPADLAGERAPVAFVELHVEQGPVLEAQDIAIGAVGDLQGISWTEVVLEGASNHAGTTPMDLRQDPARALPAILATVNELPALVGGRQLATVGVIELEPNQVNVIPARVRITFDLRNTSEEDLVQAERLLQERVEAAAREVGVTSRSRSLARTTPVTFDPGLVQRIEASARRRELSVLRMTSGAGHDAQMMARVAPAAMIFVPSRGGISHDPAEHTDPNQLVAGAEVLADVLLELADDPEPLSGVHP